MFHGKLRDISGAAVKTNFTIGEIVMPHSLESIVKP